jgi:hypothetical protein
MMSVIARLTVLVKTRDVPVMMCVLVILTVLVIQLVPVRLLSLVPARVIAVE